MDLTSQVNRDNITIEKVLCLSIYISNGMAINCLFVSDNKK